MKSSEIREKFIAFFIKKGHTFVKSSSVVPQNDPTILFTNAGMNQFKDVFLGQGARDYTRAVNSQTCIRVSGKHNDLEDVGLDTTHLTLFEMLGNWSFGDYYKKEAIAWAWEFLTQEMQLPETKLYATVYKTDDESIDLWKTTSINPDHILKFAEKENFWEMGETGPCGPCSELHLDRGPEACDKPGTPHNCAVNGDCARYVELWNLVFIQYNRLSNGSLEELPNKHVDTGAGLERITAYLQNTRSNYETDLFLPIIQTIETLSHVPYQDTPACMPHRVMADHIRTLVFAITDNVMPSNEGRGYVLRRLLRRALRYASKLNIHEPILYKLVDPVVAVLGGHFESLVQRQTFVKQVIKAEEESFLRTLESGLSQFEQTVDKIRASHAAVIPGAEAFKLYDTYGFPLDLTQVMAKELQLQVDTVGFDQALEEQREKSRKQVKLHQANFKEVPMGGEARITHDPIEKLAMAKHHSGTHLLQAALRQVLGDHVYQAGSLVDIDRLRFDFSHFHAIPKETVRAIETLVNQKIQEGIEVEAFLKPLEEAKAMGAMALFGEKYEDTVRVIRMGDFSMELCVGTHVPNTRDIEQIKIIHESAVSAGTRRIEALAGKTLIEAYFEGKKEEIKTRIASKTIHYNTLLKEKESLGGAVTPLSLSSLEGTLEDLQRQEEALLSQLKDLEKDILSLKNKAAGQQTEGLLSQLKPLGGGLQSLIALVPQYDIPMLRTLSDNLIANRKQTIVILASQKEGQGHFLVKLSSDIQQIQAPAILQNLVQIAGGKGGGKNHMAQAGGASPEKLETALTQVRTYLQQLVLEINS